MHTPRDPLLQTNEIRILRIKAWTYFKSFLGNSLVVRWMRLRLLMQRTRVRSLVREDSTCCRPGEPMHHD